MKNGAGKPEGHDQSTGEQTPGVGFKSDYQVRALTPPLRFEAPMAAGASFFSVLINFAGETVWRL
jgi:hypothetical protein